MCVSIQNHLKFFLDMDVGTAYRTMLCIDLLKNYGNSHREQSYEMGMKHNFVLAVC